MALAELRPAPPATVRVVAAAARVPAGAVLEADDVSVVRVPEAGVQPGALTAVEEVVGRRTAAGLAAGETVTRTRLVPRSRAEGLAPGRVALHVALADPVTADVVGLGQRVLVFSALGGQPLARDAVVLATDPPPAGDDPGPGGGARGVVLALPATEAEQVLSGHGGLEGPVLVNVVAAGP